MQIKKDTKHLDDFVSFFIDYSYCFPNPQIARLSLQHPSAHVIASPKGVAIFYLNEKVTTGQVGELAEPARLGEQLSLKSRGYLINL